MSKVLVSGGAGFIGSHVTELLMKCGHQVTVLDNLSQGNRDWVPAGAAFIEGDVCDLPLVRRLCDGQDGVFHLAAMSRVLPSLRGGPSATLFSAENNITGTLNMLVASAEAKVGKFIYSASSTCYGNLPAPHHEKLIPACETPYAVSKYAGEMYAMQFTRMYGLPVVSLRYFQVYGPRQPVSGEYAMVTGIFLDQKKRGDALTIHGNGSQRRDFVHVHDVALANLKAFESNLGWHIINIGTGTNISIKELADMISGDQVYLPARKHDMQATLADIARCSALLGWVPEIRINLSNMG